MTGGAVTSQKRFYGIREVADLCGVEPHVLRYWEEEFPALRPLRRSGNRRYYRPEDVAVAQRIRYLVRDCKYTIEGARHRLQHGAPEPANGKEVLHEVRGELEGILRQLDGGGPSIDRGDGHA
ncbi:MAG TPA: MerR family transcriptional regulator [Gammaproteobacteria bacterium]|nr:MerR family transcriptional regulator [Gammaproteobacteria bacterium]